MSSVHNHLSTVIILALAFYFLNLNDVLIQYINEIFNTTNNICCHHWANLMHSISYICRWHISLVSIAKPIYLFLFLRNGKQNLSQNSLNCKKKLCVINIYLRYGLSCVKTNVTRLGWKIVWTMCFVWRLSVFWPFLNQIHLRFNNYATKGICFIFNHYNVGSNEFLSILY